MLMVCDPRTTTTTSSGIFLDFNLVEGENEAGVRAATGAFLRCDMCPGLLVFVVQFVIAIEIRVFCTTAGARGFANFVVVVHRYRQRSIIGKTEVTKASVSEDQACNIHKPRVFGAEPPTQKATHRGKIIVVQEVQQRCSKVIPCEANGNKASQRLASEILSIRDEYVLAFINAFGS